MDITLTDHVYQCSGRLFDLRVAAAGEQAERKPAILIAPAWDGANTHMDDIALRIAKLGYVAAVVDVYGQSVRGNPLGDNTHLMAPLMEDRAELTRRMNAALEHVSSFDSVNPDRVGAIGYCFGGLCVLDLARSVPRSLQAVVSFHGGLTGSNLPVSGNITSPILIEHGAADPVVPIDDYILFTQEMDERKADWQAHVHGGAAHAFTFSDANMPESGIVYHEKAAKRSWQSMMIFLRENV